MSLFGKIGDKVVITKGREFHDSVIPKGTVMRIQDNTIDEDGDIKLTSLDKILVDVYIGYQNIKPWSKSEWEFKVPVFCEIDFELMSRDLTKKDPLMLVNASVYNRIVIVHSSLLTKAKILGIEKPYNTKLIKKNPNILIIDDHFSEWIDWAKCVKNAKWEHKIKGGISVKVSIPTI